LNGEAVAEVHGFGVGEQVLAGERVADGAEEVY
jgi:hypothetical protein